MRKAVVWALVMLALSAPHAGADATALADELVLSALRAVDPNIRAGTTLARIAAGDFDLLLVASTSRDQVDDLASRDFRGDRSSSLVLLKKERTRKHPEVLTVVREFAIGSKVRVLRSAADEIVLARSYDDEGASAPHLKLFVDPGVRTVRTTQFQPFGVQEVYVDHHVPHFVVGDGKRFLVIRATTTAPFLELLSDSASAPFVSALPVKVAMVSDREVRTIERRRPELVFGPEGTFRWKPLEPGKVFEKTASGGKVFPLPQSTQAEWVKARPYAAGKTDTHSPTDAGFSCPSCQPEESIGPAQIVGSRLWFGKSFIDGEGSTGIGGVGNFDTTSRKFTMLTIPGAVNHSVSALLVEGQTIWIGLLYNSSCSDDLSGGLLRVDRISGESRRYDLSAIASSIVRYEDRVYVATSDGVTVIDRAGEAELFFVDRAQDDSLKLAKSDSR
jgi:hypothetical protein